jgi:hypothetical protein
MSDDLIALKNNRGADTANIENVSYTADVDGVFHVSADVARQLLDVPAGFALAHDEPQPRITTMDFLGTPFMNYEVGGRRFEADANGIIADVPPGNYGALLEMGCVALPPPNWVDPRVA